VFGALAEDVVTRDPLVRVDAAVAAWLHARATPGLTAAFAAFTMLGSAWVIVPLALIVIVGLLVYSRRAEALFLALVLAGAEGLTLGLKAGFGRQRPYFADPLAVESSFSFPSGHATVSLAVYGALGFLLARRAATWRGRALWLGAATVLILLIGASRLFLGVHFLSDVLAGFSAGLVWLTLCAISVFRPSTRR
jgi:membrane-associated phospholipid phosphatase